MRLTGNDLMPFGRYFKWELKDIPVAYLTWSACQEWVEREYPDVYAYILENHGFGVESMKERQKLLDKEMNEQLY